MFGNGKKKGDVKCSLLYSPIWFILIGLSSFSPLFKHLQQKTAPFENTKSLLRKSESMLEQGFSFSIFTRSSLVFLIVSFQIFPWLPQTIFAAAFVAAMELPLCSSLFSKIETKPVWYTWKKMMMRDHVQRSNRAFTTLPCFNWRQVYMLTRRVNPRFSNLLPSSTLRQAAAALNYLTG